MVFGVLGFGYATFPHFQDQLAEQGFYTVNLGDNAQTIAARALWLRNGVAPDRIVRIDRDMLSAYEGPAARLLMNGVFRGPEFPLPSTILPIFMGFCAGGAVVRANADYLRRHQPIGCRDAATWEALKALGIEAFVSGCVTLTLPRRAGPPGRPRTLIVSGSGAGAMPPGLLAAAPSAVLAEAEFIHHRLPVWEHPLSERTQDHVERYEAHLLDRYATEAGRIVTPLHHVAAPCLAMGVPVILARQKDDGRFSHLAGLTPLHLPEMFDRIDWDPAPVDTGPTRALFDAVIQDRLSRPPTS